MQFMDYGAHICNKTHLEGALAHGGSGASSVPVHGGGGGGCAPLQRLPPPSSSAAAAAERPHSAKQPPVTSLARRQLSRTLLSAPLPEDTRTTAQTS